MGFGDWGYETCPRCGRTVVSAAAEVHNLKFHGMGVSGTVRKDDPAFDSPAPPTTPEEKMARVLTDEEVWG